VTTVTVPDHQAHPLRVELAHQDRTTHRPVHTAAAHNNSVYPWLAGTPAPLPRNAAKINAVLATPAGYPFRPVTSRSDTPADAPRRPRRSRRAADTPAGNGRLLTVAEALAVSPTADPGWQQRARCADGTHDPELWWPEQDDNATPARRICAGCPVLGDCRQQFFTNPGLDESGIWAGVSGAALRQAARATQPGRPPARQPNVEPVMRAEPVTPAPHRQRRDASRTALIRSLGWEQ
jgi:WhiB family transcriptional regulator, redox-sensing transcriptional regulator